MTLDKDNRATVKAEPQTAGPDFYDQAPYTYGTPEGQRELDQWGDGSQASSLPFRGFVQHGVPYQPDAAFIPHDVATMGNDVRPMLKEVLGDPVPVVIVGYPDPLGVANSFTTTAYGYAGGETVRLAHYRPERNRLLLRVTAGTVYIGATPEHAASGLGYAIDTGSGEVALNVNKPVYGYASAAATVTLLEEFTVTNGGKAG